MNVLEREIVSASELRCLLSALTELKPGFPAHTWMGKTL